MPIKTSYHDYVCYFRYRLDSQQVCGWNVGSVLRIESLLGEEQIKLKFGVVVSIVIMDRDDIG